MNEIRLARMVVRPKLHRFLSHLVTRRAWSWTVVAMLAIGVPAVAGYSNDEVPTETPVDPGDVFFLGGGLEVDDGPCPGFPIPAPCLGVPSPPTFDLDAFSVADPVPLCPGNVNYEPGILFSLDDGDPGAGVGLPDRPLELFFYDHCGSRGGGSHLTNIRESSIALGINPPPTANDDDVDAFESRGVLGWNGGQALLFSPDTPSVGGLLGGCGAPEGNIYRSDNVSSAVLFADPCSLGVPDTQNCDIDALLFADAQTILFSTDHLLPCGLDPGDIYVSDNSGTAATLFADDVHDLRIATTEFDRVDLDALSVNTDTDGVIQIGDPFVPFYWKRDYPDYAPSGIPDFSQDHANFPTPLGFTTYCGPTAVADCFWWFDSKFEGGCPGGGPGDGVDDFPLVEDLVGLDDHAPGNVEPLIVDLAACMNTDGLGPGTGTFLDDMTACIDQWLVAAGLRDGFTLQQVPSPTAEEIACEIERSENVILLLGYWWFDGQQFQRCGGHYVTSAGVRLSRNTGADGAPGAVGVDDDLDGTVDEPDEMCPCDASGLVVYGDDVCAAGVNEIGVSDPGLNNAEPAPAGNAAAGHVAGPSHASHAPVLPAPPPPPDHDNARNLSHDVYEMVPSGTGLYSTALVGYGQPPGSGLTVPCASVARWCGQNPSEAAQSMASCGGADPVFVEIEAMIDLSPVTCEICLDVRAGLNSLVMHKGVCPAPAFTANTYDYIRGELCQISEAPGSLDLGEVTCLADDTPEDQRFDDTTPLFTRGIGAWFYLARPNAPPCDYGLSSAGNARTPSLGDCPCP